jgi:pimeloyl-ACP methyl ester carboxylesterase
MSQRQFQHDGITVNVEDRGSGPAIVLVHGFPLDHRMWQAQIEELGSRFRVVAPDLRGFGHSTLTDADVELGVSMERYAADVVAALDWLQIAEPVVAVGFSMGGYAAWQLALCWPHRWRGLVLCDTRAAGDADEARANRLKMADAAMQAGNSSPALAMLPKLLAPKTHAERPDIVEATRVMIERQTAEAVAAAQRGMARREDVTGRLREIACPALCIVGVEDAISTPAEMHQIATLLAETKSPEVRLVEIEAAGHMTPLENPAAVTEAIADFARECYLSSGDF